MTTENKPDMQVAPGRGITIQEKQKRKITLSRLLQAGMPDDEIAVIMGRETNPDGSPGFAMSYKEVQKAITSVFASWAEEDSIRNPHLKSAARRRIYDEITNARKSGAWTAVASFEKVLAQIEGTIEDGQSRAPAEIRIDNAVLYTIGEMDTGALREIIEQERQLFTKESKKLGPAEEEKITVTPVVKKDE